MGAFSGLYGQIEQQKEAGRPEEARFCCWMRIFQAHEPHEGEKPE